LVEVRRATSVNQLPERQPTPSATSTATTRARAPSDSTPDPSDRVGTSATITRCRPAPCQSPNSTPPRQLPSSSALGPPEPWSAAAPGG